MAYVDFKNSPSEETPLTGGATGNLNVMQENGTSHGTDTKLGYAQSFLNDHIVNVSNEVDEDYRVNLLHSKNLFDKNNPKLLNAYIDGNGKITSDAGNRVVYIPIKPNTTYTISKMVSQRFRVGTYTTIPVANATATNIGTNAYTDATATITSGANDYYLAVWFYNSNFDTENYQTIMNTIQIEIGSTATTYEDYITPSIYVDNEEIYKKQIDGKGIFTHSSINYGDAFYHKLGNLVIVNIQDLQVSTAIPSSGQTKIGEGFPKNISDENHIAEFGVLENYNNGSTAYTIRVIIDTNGELLLNYSNIPTGQRFYGTFVYLTND